MKFKLDENLGPRTAAIFAAAGYDVVTVPQQRLSGSSDVRLFEVCMAEGRCLVTLDMDFADVIRFPPRHTAGIAVLRLPRGVSMNLLSVLVRNLLAALATEPITGRLWVVEAGRIRLHEDGRLTEEEP